VKFLAFLTSVLHGNECSASHSSWSDPWERIQVCMVKPQGPTPTRNQNTAFQPSQSVSTGWLNQGNTVVMVTAPEIVPCTGLESESAKEQSCYFSWKYTVLLCSTVDHVHLEYSIMTHRTHKKTVLSTSVIHFWTRWNLWSLILTEKCNDFDDI
jgi:hypothetical protein